MRWRLGHIVHLSAGILKLLMEDALRGKRGLIFPTPFDQNISKLHHTLNRAPPNRQTSNTGKSDRRARLPPRPSRLPEPRVRGDSRRTIGTSGGLRTLGQNISHLSPKEQG